MKSGRSIVTFPSSRLATVDLGRYGRNRHAMYGLLEVDVTLARQAARLLRRSGSSGSSFTAWMVKAVADSVARHREVHAVAVGRRKVVLFESVDIALPVDRAVESGRAPLPVLIRQAESLSVAQIGEAIDAATRQQLADERSYVLGSPTLSAAAIKLYYRLPGPLRLLAWRVLLGNAERAKRHSGTVTMTTVGGSGRTAGWIVPTRSMHNLHISLGPITRKPRVVGDRIVAREVMHLTVAFNHDVVDGVPARQFMEDLVARIERGALD